MTPVRVWGSPCMACFHLEATFKYCQLDCALNGDGGFEVQHRLTNDDSLGPHLHRVCKRCGYEWLEQPLGLRPVERTS